MSVPDFFDLHFVDFVLLLDFQTFDDFETVFFGLVAFDFLVESGTDVVVSSLDPLSLDSGDSFRFFVVGVLRLRSFSSFDFLFVPRAEVIGMQRIQVILSSISKSMNVLGIWIF